MANHVDYLTEYRQFFEDFANTVEPNDQLPVKLGSYKFLNSEVVGGIIDWCLQYLSRKSCPSTLVGPLIKITIDEIRAACKKHPIACGFNTIENVYEPLKLMQTVMNQVNEICLRYLDNSKLDTLPTPPTVQPSKVSVCATRNTRRRMEDRHVVIHDLNSMFNLPDSLTSYYAIFDGHAGPDAASYSAAHLHQFLVESEFYPTDPERALKEAFLRTDEFFCEKSKVENFRSGTTAVCALLRPKEETLYVAWVGDSQALLVNRGKVLQIVKPHKPSREDEKDRIEANGGCVMFWGMWRVNGQLAVSRAIGDIKLKPYVTAEPDIVAVPLDGNEEFLIMACDGLWDFVSEDIAALTVYKHIKENPENVENIAENLANFAKDSGSRDNISVIVIFLKDPQKIVKKLPDWGWSSQQTTDVTMETGVDNQINNASNNYDLFDVFQKRGTIDHFNDEADFKPNGTEAKTDLFLFDRPTNGKRPASEFEDDLGPETNIDSLDELSPIEKESHKMADFDIKMAEDIPDNIAHTITDNIMETITENDEKSITGNNNSKKLDEDLDLEVQGHQINELEPVKDVREETPTPPADSVLDSSGVADNVAESEDSEDEWNYYRVDPKQKENSSPPVETDNKVSDPSDEMSQLNPDAKEFVPVSPTRVASSPVPYPRDLIDDPLIAQSPRRALPMDINLPSPVEFQCEVKQRPSELFDEFEDKTDEQNGHQLSSQEIMQNLLNGKDVSEIEFHPHNISKSSGDNIFEGEIENQNLIEISKENLSPSDKTESSLSPEEQNFANFPAKTQDPMSMSFYQDKDEEKDSFSTNPFDLNKVQVLPENIDDFIEKTDVVSPVESPLGIPLAKTPEIGDKIGSPVPNLDNSKSLIEIANSPICDVAKSPEISENVAKSPEITELSEDLICAFAKSPEIAKSSEDLICAVAKSPEIAKSPDDLICAVAKSPEIAKSPEDLICAVAKSPEIAKSSEDLICAVAKSPEICKEQKVPEISQTLFCDFTTEPIIHPIPDVTNSPENSPMGPLSPKSPIPELTGLVSPDITASIKDENVSEEISDTKSPILDIKTPENLEKIATPEVSKVEELISEAIQDIPGQISDFCEISGTIAPISGTPEPILEKKVDLVSDIEIKANFEQILAPNDELGQNLSGTSSEAVNAFLERSHVPEVTSPLSPSEEIEKFQTEPPENWKIEIKTEVIQPEFPITTIASPCEENKEEIPPPTPKKIEEPVEKKSAKITSKPLSAKKSPASPASKLGDQKTDKKTPRAPITKTRTPISSPRVPPLKTTPTQPAKKLTNGDVKSTVKTTNLVKKTTTTVTKSAVEKTEKKNPIKPPSAVSATSRPATATRTVGSTASRAPASRPMSATAPKAKPGTLPAKTTTSSATTKPPPIRQPVAGATRSAPTTLKPRLPSTSTVPKPRPPSTTSTRTVTKQPDTEKQQKDTVNKQLSKTTSRTTAVTKSSTLPPKRTDLKTSVSSRIQTTRTTTTTLKSTTKKPDITKTAITKTKTSSTKPAAEQNGVNIVQEIKTTIEEPQLIKDNSPVEIDNSKIQEVIAD